MVMKKIFAKEGMRIRLPGENYRVLGKEGAVVQWNMHWAKAEQRGEITVEDVQVEPSEARDKAAPRADQKADQRGDQKADPKAAKPKTPGVAVS
jgi:hypothetical protein